MPPNGICNEKSRVRKHALWQKVRKAVAETCNITPRPPRVHTQCAPQTAPYYFSTTKNHIKLPLVRLVEHGTYAEDVMASMLPHISGSHVGMQEIARAETVISLQGCFQNPWHQHVTKVVPSHGAKQKNLATTRLHIQAPFKTWRNARRDCAILGDVEAVGYWRTASSRSRRNRWRRWRWWRRRWGSCRRWSRRSSRPWSRRWSRRNRCILERGGDGGGGGPSSTLRLHGPEAMVPREVEVRKREPGNCAGEQCGEDREEGDVED